MSRLVSCLTLAALAASCGGPQANLPINSRERTEMLAPASAREPVTDTYHGVTVSEDYRWLESWDDGPVQAWTQAQNDYARAWLDALPGTDTLRNEVEAILRGEIVAYYDLAFAGEQLFAAKWAPPAQQPLIVAFDDYNDASTERVVLDPAVLDPTGSTTVDWYFPSHDGKLIAVSLSRGGSESGELNVFDVATGARVHEVIPGVNGGTAGGWLAWAPDDSGFYYTRYPRPGARAADDMAFFVQLYYHALGTPPETDRYELGENFPRIAEIDVRVDAGSGRVLCTVQNGDGGEFALYVKEPAGAWQQFSVFGDGMVQATFGPADDLLVVSNRDAPHGRVLRVPLAELDMGHATELLPHGEDTVVNSFWGSPSVLVTEHRIYVVYQRGGPSEVRAFTHDGQPAAAPTQLPVADAGGLVPLGGDDILFINGSFVEPASVYHFAATSGSTTRTALETKVPVRYEDVEVVRELAVSADGTQVPVNILRPASAALDGSAPLVLYGYGGYGVSLTPRFSAVNTVLLRHGVTYAVANLRGGGEFGEAWHRQGYLTAKQNVFDDFYAVARHLIDRGYTSSSRLVLKGGSNGGLLMGATLVQHPALAKAVVSAVGIYDMLRVELSSNGAFNVTEFGTVGDADQFAALYAYSPYHHVMDGVAYPPVLMTTGANDPRVDPMQSRKMTARLQAAAPTGGPFLLLTSMDTGHGAGTPLDVTIRQVVDEFAFVLHHLEVAID